MIANRIKRVIDEIVSNNQTGFIKGRYIGENVRTIIEAMEQTEHNNEPGLIFFSDFHKAFDSLDHMFMFKTLRKLNFSDSLIQWVDIFYKDAKGCITNNGHFSDFFKISSGVRQGCPLSPYLFILSIELLSNAVEKNRDIAGIKIDETTETKQTLFADDASFLLDGSISSFTNLVKTLDDFGETSGLKLNKDKCFVLRIGSLKNTEVNYNHDDNEFKWTSSECTTLGMVFNTNLSLMHELNITPKINECKKVLKQWNKWNLTLIGKIAVLKTFALPKLIYPLTILETPPQKYITEINNMFYDFLWNSKPDKIARNIITQDYKDGGLKMIDIDFFICSLKISWIKRIFNSHASWSNHYRTQLKAYGEKLLFECNINERDCKDLRIKSQFLKDVLTSWAKVNNSCSDKPLSKEIVWNNSKIKLNNTKTLFYKAWYDKGIKFIEHLFDFRSKQFYTFEQMKQLYGIPNGDFLKYYTLICNIPLEWKTNLKTEDIVYNTPKYLIDKLDNEKTKLNKIAYKILIKRKRPNNPKYQLKWSIPENLNWENIHRQPFHVTIYTKLREFQYKYLMNIIPNNAFLYKCKIVNSNLCDFCNMFIDSSQHMFWECNFIQTFWTDIQNFLTIKLSRTIIFSKETISFCNVLTNSDGDGTIVNYVTLLAKYFILKNKCNKTIPTVQAFQKYLIERKKIEEYIAFNKGN